MPACSLALPENSTREPGLQVPDSGDIDQSYPPWPPPAPASSPGPAELPGGPARSGQGSTWNLVDLSLRAVWNWVPVRVTVVRRPFLTPVTMMVETR
jgi:hypothetical protein